MIKVKYNSSIGIEYFYKLFSNRKHLYPTGYFFDLKPSRKKIEVPRLLFKSIVSGYFDAYFTDFYSHSNEQYFPLSGKMVKARGKNFFKNKNSSIVTECVTWTWFLRPAMNYFSNIRLNKLTGSTSRVAVLERSFKGNFDVALLTKATDILKEKNINNKLYR